MKLTRKIFIALFTASVSATAQQSNYLHCQEAISLLSQKELSLQIKFEHADFIIEEVLKASLLIVNNSNKVLTIPKFDRTLIEIEWLQRRTQPDGSVRFRRITDHEGGRETTIRTGCLFPVQQVFPGESIAIPILGEDVTASWEEDNSTKLVMQSSSSPGPGRIFVNLGPISLTGDYRTVDSKLLKVIRVQRKKDSTGEQTEESYAGLMVFEAGGKFLLMGMTDSFKRSFLESANRIPAALEEREIRRASKVRLAELDEMPDLVVRRQSAVVDPDDVSISAKGRTVSLREIRKLTNLK